MFKMIVQMHGRQEVTEHATIAEARERLVDIAVASNSRVVGDNTTGEFILRDRDGNDRVLGWTFGAYLIEAVDPDALVYVVEHADGRDEFGSDAEAKHFQTTIAPGSSRYAERVNADEPEVTICPPAGACHHFGFNPTPHGLRWNAKAFGVGAPYADYLVRLLPIAAEADDLAADVAVVEHLVERNRAQGGEGLLYVDSSELAAVGRVVAEIVDYVKVNDYANDGSDPADRAAAVAVADLDGYMLTTCAPGA
ncbi:hypothetical protein SEA_ELLIE_90 [Mycobacterium phage Ellie]|uniref:Uncharacterized protein n=1 Tax=Mycobacterium phage Ellie TaxID=2762405 RepID=A0A7G8LM41_9CAUD|nr:hypothetical protein I5G88_gp90 [Mycobacterium phage Ellie]QNJ58313.1 hypothetical protein SEA_ELLIE_90 [Mycobacterium phage Ellie]